MIRRLDWVGTALTRPLPALLAFAAAWALFLGALHPWLLDWGSTAEERSTALPGDTAAPSAYLTRAIAIDAPPEAVWPWLMQIGQDRAGFYSNDWLENLFGADIHNANVLRPDWQARAVGDRIPMAGGVERQLGGDYTLLTVRQQEVGQVYGDVPGRFVLQPTPSGGTRLLLREALAIPERSGLTWLIWDPMHFVMEQRMLQGIKERAEGRPLVAPPLQVGARAGWTLAGLGLLAIFLRRPGWRPWLVAPAIAALPPLWLAGDADAALAGGLAVGITVAGGLTFGWRRVWGYLPLASAVALVLLLTPDAYTAFGLIFLVGVLGALPRLASRLPRFSGPRLAPA